MLADSIEPQQYEYRPSYENTANFMLQSLELLE